MNRRHLLTGASYVLVIAVVALVLWWASVTYVNIPRMKKSDWHCTHYVGNDCHQWSRK